MGTLKKKKKKITKILTQVVIQVNFRSAYQLRTIPNNKSAVLDNVVSLIVVQGSVGTSLPIDRL